MKKIIVLPLLLVLVSAATGRAATDTDLAKQVAELTRQNQALLERVMALEKKMADDSQPVPAAEGEKKEQGGEESSMAKMIKDHVELGGLVEVEAGGAEDFAGVESSDITLATAALHLDARISEWSRAHLVLLYEEGEEDNHVIVDEGAVTLDNEEGLPVTLTAGKMYLPFGVYESNMVSDTLPLELGEINDSAVLGEVRHAGFRGVVHVFNGDMNEAGESDRIDSWGASVHYGQVVDSFTLDGGVDWLSNIGDSDGLGDYLEDTGVAALAEYVDGLAAHFLLRYGPFAFIAEYVSALDEFTAAEMPFAGSGAKPEAWSLEAGWAFELLPRQIIFSVAWQGTDESLALGLPAERYLAVIRMMILANTSLALEYRHDEDYTAAEGGTGESGAAATLQLAVEF